MVYNINMNTKNKLFITSLVIMFLVVLGFIWKEYRSSDFQTTYKNLSPSVQNCIKNGVNKDFFDRLMKKGELFDESDSEQISIITNCFNQ